MLLIADIYNQLNSIHNTRNMYFISDGVNERNQIRITVLLVVIRRLYVLQIKDGALKIGANRSSIKNSRWQRPQKSVLLETKRNQSGAEKYNSLLFGEQQILLFSKSKMATSNLKQS